MVSDASLQASAPAATTAEVFEPVRRVVLLGASNMARGIASLIPASRAAWGGPLEVLGAFGHGRSLGMTSQVLCRSLPSILSCGLWEALDRLEPLPTAILMTDIGNDLLYGADADQILRWVETCLQRLAPHQQRLVVTLLPAHSLARLTPARFRLLRSMLFPRSRLQFVDALRQVEEINRTLESFSGAFRAYVLRPLPDWYGWDPIHIRRDSYPRAWQRLTTPWCDGQVPDLSVPRWSQWYVLRRQKPLQRGWFGRLQHHPQPACTLPDSTRIWLF